MTANLHAAIRAQLAKLHPPAASSKARQQQSAAAPEADGSAADIISLGLISNIFTADGKAFFAISIPAEEAPLWEGLRREAEQAAAQTAGIKRAFVTLTAERPPAAEKKPAAAAAPRPGAAHNHGVKPAAKAPLPGVKHIIAVASGKGGVGKSTCAVNLAAALTLAGLKTGLMDADIYGPSLPRLTGLVKPRGEDMVEFRDKKLVPLERYGLKLMSMGFLTEEEAPLVWRGPMVMTAINQLLHDVLWAPLDILVVDMPPGTGDAQLSLAQKVPLSGAVIVSTPQELALIDARKGLEMFNKIHVPILGLIENMSRFIAPDTGKSYPIFGGVDASGKGGAEREAEKRGLPFLGALPLDPRLSAASDSGAPIVISDAASPLSAVYRAAAAEIMRQLHFARK